MTLAGGGGCLLADPDGLGAIRPHRSRTPCGDDRFGHAMPMSLTWRRAGGPEGRRADVYRVTLGYGCRCCLPPKAWTGSWTGAPANPRAAGAVGAMIRAIVAASALGRAGLCGGHRGGAAVGLVCGAAAAAAQDGLGVPGLLFADDRRVCHLLGEQPLVSGFQRMGAAWPSATLSTSRSTRPRRRRAGQGGAGCPACISARRHGRAGASSAGRRRAPPGRRRWRGRARGRSCPIGLVGW